MKRNGSLALQVTATLVILAVLNTGCDLVDTVVRAIRGSCDRPEFVVTRTDDPSSGICGDSTCSLRQAITLANACPGVQTIRVLAGTYSLRGGGTGIYAFPEIADSMDIIGEELPFINLNLTVSPGATVNLTNLISLGILNQGTLNATRVYVDINGLGEYGIHNLGDLAFSHGTITGILDGTAGLWNEGHAVLDNVSISHTDRYGIQNDTGGEIQISYSTIAYNRDYQIKNDGAITISNSLIYGDGEPGWQNGCTGTPLISSGYNIDSFDTCGFHAPGDLVNTDPRFYDQTAFDINDRTIIVNALPSGSPAIDSADPAVCGGTDLLGVSRPQGSGCDRGALEAPPGLGQLPIFEPPPTGTPTPTSTVMSLFFIPYLNIYCRSGPDPIFDVIDVALEGQSYLIDGRNAENTWFRIMLDPITGCWVLQTSGAAPGVPSLLRVLFSPPTPTLTPLPFNCAQFKDTKSCNETPACFWQSAGGTCTNK